MKLIWNSLAVLSALCFLPFTGAAQDESCVEFWQSAIERAEKSPNLNFLNVDVMKEQLEECEGTSSTYTPTPAPTSTPRPTPTERPPRIIAQGTIVGDINVNVRSCASTNCEAVTSIVPGETVHIISEADGWYEVLLEPGGNSFFIASFLVKPEYCAENVPASGASRGGIRFPHLFCTFAQVEEHLEMAVTEFEYIDGNVWHGRWYFSPATGFQFLQVGVSFWCSRRADDVCETGRGYKFSVVGDGWVSEYEGDVNDYQDFRPLSPGGGGFREMIFHVKQGEQHLMLRYDPIAYGYDVQFFDIFPKDMI